MPAIFRSTDMSVGSDSGAATACTALTQASKTYWGGSLVALVGDQFQPHTIPGPVVHSGAQRQITAGSSTMFFEGKSVARTGDPIADGDQCGAGLSTASAG
jgi:uncharacterized Zn-binding protein involved in type VI secretion